MKSIKSYLKTHSIYRERRTTINGVFASAIAAVAEYDEERVSEALLFLGQDPQEDLRCVYCEGAAKTWDHLVGLVKNSGPSGSGHLIGNLVPSCKDCNSAKGSKDWREFLKVRIQDPEARDSVERRLSAYIAAFSVVQDYSLDSLSRKMQEYDGLRLQILDLMKRADVVAKDIRESAIAQQACPPETDAFKPVNTKGIVRLLSFIPYFEGELQNLSELGGGGESESGMIQMPYVRYSNQVSQFVEALYESGLVQSFDWTRWQSEANRYLEDKRLLQSADMDTMIRLFTTHARKEKFCEGHLGSVIRNGHVLDLLRRLEVLAGAVK